MKCKLIVLSFCFIRNYHESLQLLYGIQICPVDCSTSPLAQKLVTVFKIQEGGYRHLGFCRYTHFRFQKGALYTDNVVFLASSFG